MNLVKRTVNFTKKLLKRQDLVKIKYDKQSWDTQFAKGNWDFLIKDSHENVTLVADELRRLCRLKKRKIKVLDVGCGNGALAKILNKNEMEYLGIDISTVAIDEAKKNTPWAVFIQSNMDNPNFQPDVGTFDVIVFCEVLVYVDYETVLSKYSKYLANEGLFLISLYNVWRTKWIIRSIVRQVKVLKKIFVKNITRNIGWTIIVAKLK